MRIDLLGMKFVDIASIASSQEEFCSAGLALLAWAMSFLEPCCPLAQGFSLSLSLSFSLAGLRVRISGSALKFAVRKLSSSKNCKNKHPSCNNTSTRT